MTFLKVKFVAPFASYCVALSGSHCHLSPNSNPKYEIQGWWPVSASPCGTPVLRTVVGGPDTWLSGRALAEHVDLARGSMVEPLHNCARPRVPSTIKAIVRGTSVHSFRRGSVLPVFTEVWFGLVWFGVLRQGFSV